MQAKQCREVPMMASTHPLTGQLHCVPATGEDRAAEAAAKAMRMKPGEMLKFMADMAEDEVHFARLCDAYKDGGKAKADIVSLAKGLKCGDPESQKAVLACGGGGLRRAQKLAEHERQRAREAARKAYEERACAHAPPDVDRMFKKVQLIPSSLLPAMGGEKRKRAC